MNRDEPGVTRKGRQQPARHRNNRDGTGNNRDGTVAQPGQYTNPGRATATPR
ncbi:hypothetical protein DPMN_099136 [Dreissena polymorpha]|uniref:Uncharacterized protein n=1 Tax=Dreissena polymorpha TaxID=45954 RepID=A0A9D4R653_DREPO|nr:hypothetical protein DPMN_099136 [Dreissena polymorpha]